MCKAIRILHDTLQASGNKGVAAGILFALTFLPPALSPAAAVSADNSESFIAPFGYVTDLARQVDPEVERKICDISSELERKTGIRVAVVTIPNLSGYEIEDFTNELMVRCFPDPADRAKSIVIIDASYEEKLRLEMGVALDTMLTSEAARRIRERVLLPALQKGDKGEAYLLTIMELASEIATHQGITLYQLKGPGFLKNRPAVVSYPPGRRRDTSSSLWFLPVIMAALWIGYREARAAALAAKTEKTTRSE
jgi:uncharacterized membrane protein YgcG